MSSDNALASPNKMVWIYFSLLRRMLDRIGQMPEGDERKQEIAASLILSVTAVEAFTNVYFRVVVSEPEFAHQESMVKGDLGALISVKTKLTKWTAELFGSAFNFNSGVGKLYVELNQHRNKLVHFKSAHETVTLPGIVIDGMADISAFTALVPAHAESAVTVAEKMLYEVFRLRGIPESKLPDAMHAWTGSPITFSS